jgi:LytTr DNA-binding domain
MLRPADRWLPRYLAVRRRVEVAAWVLAFAVQIVANSLVVVADRQRMGLSFQPWQIVTWEATSNLMWLLLVPAVVWALNRWPLRWCDLRRHLSWHLLAGLACSTAHVMGMVAFRHVVYALHGTRYDFGPWLNGLAYEALKDLRTYALIALSVCAYRLLLWRWQGEALWLGVPDGAPAPTPTAIDAPAKDPPSAPPERLLVKKLGKEFLLPVADIEWVQACGNYVNLHRRQHDYPLRSTFAAIEQRLDGAGFVRVHRSYLVNLALVQVIEPTEAGDARLHLLDGSTVPCSRTYLDSLRKCLRLATDQADGASNKWLTAHRRIP